MTERFTKEQFEAALPVGSLTGKALWQGLGLVNGEFCYVVPVKPGVLIYVRSSVKADGIAADTGEDSIRCWIAADETGRFLGSKDSRWIARTSGWRDNMIKTLRTLWTAGRAVEHCSCGTLKLALKNKTTGAWFTKCPTCNPWRKTA